MNPLTHAVISWCTGASHNGLDRSQRTVITLAGLSPDLDGLGAIAEVLTKNSDSPLMWWSEYHHVLCHNLGFCLAVTGCTWAFTKKRSVALLSFIAFHLHLLCDLAGSRGPDGWQWPIPYFLPFSDSLQLTWSGQWPYSSWQNLLVTTVFLILAMFLSLQRNASFFELLSGRMDRAFIIMLRRISGSFS